MLEILKSTINNTPSHRIDYSRFMETVLYHPDNGYYMKDQLKIGKAGDFYTASNVDDVFAIMCANVFIEAVESELVPPMVCEIGGGTGRFASTVLREWKNKSPQTYDKLRYVLIESSPYHRRLQKEMIDDHSKLLQFHSLASAKEAIDEWQGIIFSNELFDAFPVHVVEKREGVIWERFVTMDELDCLQEVGERCQNDRVLNWIEDYHLELAEGQRIEIPVLMTDYIKELSEWVKGGLLFTVDYGYSREEWNEPIHRNGSLRGYYQHRMIENPLRYPGDMDLTTHIHFDALMEAGEANGLKRVAMLRQQEFLLSAGILEYLQEHHDPNPFSEVSKRNRAIRSLLMDTGLSSSFHVVIQQKKLDGLEKLSIWNRIK